MFNKWFKPSFILILFFLLAWFLPAEPLDPWNIFSLKKTASMIFALAFIQAMGSFMIQFLGSKRGSLLTGFLGGLISSTATTASLARQSRINNHHDSTTEALTFLAATLAMLFEAVAIVLWGSSESHPTLLIIFSGPILIAISMIIFLSQNAKSSSLKIDKIQLDIIPVIKLAVFIIVILGLSKLLQNIFGEGGLLILTFIVSLFEIHGSVIANVQLHNTGIFDESLLGGLLALSVAASFISKLFLIYTLGSAALKKKTTKYTVLLFLSLVLSWLIFIFLPL